jgi:hypothetical protein
MTIIASGYGEPMKSNMPGVDHKARYQSGDRARRFATL